MRLFKSLKTRILKSLITWSTLGKQTALAKEVYWAQLGWWIPSLTFPKKVMILVTIFKVPLIKNDKKY